MIKMTELLDDAIKKFQGENIREITLRICDSNIIRGKSVDEILDEHCGIYTIDIKTQKANYLDSAYIHALEGKRMITNPKKGTNWRGEGIYKGIPIFEVTTGGNCIFCLAKEQNIPIQKALKYMEEVYSKDKRCSYVMPNLNKVKEFMNKIK